MMDGRLEVVYIPSVMARNAMNAANYTDVKRDGMAEYYADMLSANCTDEQFEQVNRRIVQRWPKGLQYIKTRAWKLVKGPL